MELRTFIFIGASGSGKGTQVRLVEEYLKKHDPEHPVFIVQSGQYFRDFVKGDYYAAEIARKVQDTGELQPSFLAMWIWADTFVKKLKGNEHIILDGSPRTLNEAQNLDIALNFFGRKQPTVLYLNVPHQWSKDHLLERAKKEGRKDDTLESIEKRLSWFDRDVLPAIDYYRRDRHYDFYEIDGTRSIEDVHKELIARIFPEGK